MAEYLYYFTFALTVVLTLGAFAVTRNSIAKGADIHVSANRFAVASILVGLFSGILFLYGVSWILDKAGHYVNFVHGEMLIAAPIFNFLLAIVLALIGRLLLKWSQFKW